MKGYNHIEEGEMERGQFTRNCENIMGKKRTSRISPGISKTTESERD